MLTRRNIPLIVGLVAILATLGLYFLTAGKRDGAVDMWGIGFVLLAEMAVIYGAIRLSQPDASGAAKHMVYISGSLGILTAYVGAAAIISAFFMLFLPSAVRLLVVLQVILILVVMLVLAGLNTMGKKSTSQDQKTSRSVGTLQRLTQSVQLLKQNPDYNAHKIHLERLYEELRYSDYAATELDEQIETELAVLVPLLNDSAELPVKEQVDRLRGLIKERKVEVEASKRGKI